MKKKKKKFTRESWEDLTRQFKAQQAAAPPAPEEKPKDESPKVEVHIHNNVPAPTFEAPKNAADMDLERLSGRRKWL